MYSHSLYCRSKIQPSLPVAAVYCFCKDLWLHQVACRRQRMSAVSYSCMDLCKHSENEAGAPLLRYFSTLPLPDWPLFSVVGNTVSFSVLFHFWFLLETWFVFNVYDRSAKRLMSSRLWLTCHVTYFVLLSSGKKMCKWEKEICWVGVGSAEPNTIFLRLQSPSFLDRVQVW